MKSTACAGLSATIQVDGVDLNEYEHPDADNENILETVRFVEAQPDREFIIKICIDPSFKYREDALCFKIFVDGADIAEGVFRKSPFPSSQATVSGAKSNDENGNGFLRRMSFSNLETSDAVPGENDFNETKSIGQITVGAHWVKVRGDSKIEKPKHMSLKTGSVPEKSLKGQAISTRTKLSSSPEKCSPQTYVHVDFPLGPKPFATFVFKYRSRKDLQIEGLIPRAPSPVPLEDRDPDTLTIEEARALARLHRNRREEAAKIKSEVKPEKRGRSSSICLIDDDDEEEEEEDDGNTVAGSQQDTRASKRARVTSQLANSEVELLDLSVD